MITALTLALTIATPSDTLKVDTTQTRLVPTQRGDAYCTTRVITRDEMTDAHQMGLDVHAAKGCDIYKSVTRVVTAKFSNGQTRTMFIITQPEGN
jgi:hypothetical protein